MLLLTRGRAPLVLIPLLLGVASGCAGRGSGERASDWRGILGPPQEAVPTPPARRCAYMDSPASLPTLQDVLGVGAGGSLGLWGYDGDPADTLELSIRYDRTGALEWVRLVRGPLSPPRATELERLVRDHVPARGKEDWGVRLLLTGDGTPTRVLPAVACRPTQESRTRAPQPVGTNREMAELYRARGRSVEVRVALDEEGRVVDAEVVGRSGSRLFDQYAIDLVRHTRFNPKLHDGFPVASITSVRYTLPRFY